MSKKAERESKSPRTRMTGSQIKTLMACFQDNPFPTTATRQELSKILNISPRTVQIWFQNQRQKTKNRARRGSEMGEGGISKGCPAKLYILAHVATRKMEEGYELDIEC
ncbi:homeobox domain-containing protein [Encephalitozoon hellem ATCC 50504]|uniref:Homeobox protein HD-3 n=1 Tax=Encephalitozoon hellem TaxID=27973 RepID=A0A9Q9F9I4_ENCHE|nr:homeobox domain-containing protein [Encephalitozoon hellem ATCC 50504]AFM98418.1 homeobox domain-containing protein [Encephalitozoon hellem ATCC 50504]UTX43341.1 homeobox protein HD-3 [Encephalitozoon hellem]WEL38803.1 homeodomain-containing protein [Encephalitozoon hellem]|eukprot:XP_003887399.1 homeobox domain-containing protein [Encephalitozoon hellem ATCC 50504]